MFRISGVGSNLLARLKNWFPAGAGRESQDGGLLQLALERFSPAERALPPRKTVRVAKARCHSRRGRPALLQKISANQRAI